MRRPLPGSSSAVHTLEHVLDVDAAVVRGFARAVADHLHESPLTLGSRDRLLGRAQRLGIKRFDANLIVAAVEQNMRTNTRLKLAQSEARKPAPRPRWFAPASAALVVQTLIAVGAWWLLM